MRVATVTCREEEFSIERDQLNNVNDLAGSWCFGSRIHFPLKSNVEKLKDYDAVWFTMSKQIREYELRWMELLTQFKEKWPEKKVILHQEGEAEFYLMRPSTAWNIQRDWVLALKDKVDLLLTHNARDASLYRYFMDEGEVEPWRTVQDIDKISPYVIPSGEKVEKFTGISTYDGRAGGVVGLAVASQASDKITQITRSIYADDREEVMCARFDVWPNVTRQTGWFDWLKQVAGIYVYLHPMPAASAGRDTIACAALGIPVIGNKNLDAQMHLFPELAVDVYDARKQEELVRELLYSRHPRERKASTGDNIESDLFTSLYDRSRNHGLKHCKFYGIDYGVERAKKIMQRLGWE